MYLHDPPSARPWYLSCPIHRWFAELGPHTCQTQRQQSLRSPPKGRNSESSPPRSRFHPCKRARLPLQASYRRSSCVFLFLVLPFRLSVVLFVVGKLHARSRHKPSFDYNIGLS